MLKFTLIFLFVLSSFISSAQKVQNIWTLGNGKILDFNYLPPVTDTISNASFSYRMGSVCDEDGVLLFYSNGATVWNKNHVAMANGTGLINQPSWEQGNGLIIRKPDSNSIYYVFTADSLSVYYSIIDISFNNGLGRVVSKRNLLTNDYGHGMVAVKHANCQDIWLVVSARGFAGYSSYLVSVNGISSKPVGSVIGSSSPISGEFGEMAVSPNGLRLAKGFGGTYSKLSFLDIYDFNTLTGVISGAKAIQNVYSQVMYLEFSPNGNVLYVSEGSSGDPRLSQYDVSLSSSSAIKSSKYTLDSTSVIYYPNTQYKVHHDLKLGIDDKIYVKTGPHFTTDSMSIIHNPNVLGSGCNFSKNAFFYGGTRGFMPDMLTYPYQYISSNDSCFGDSTIFSVRDTSSYSSFYWDFGDTASGLNNIAYRSRVSHVFSDTGSFTVTFIGVKKSCNVLDTLYQDIYIGSIAQPDLGNDTLLCSEDTIELKANTIAESYLWSDNSDGDSLLVSESGYYWVQTQNKCGIGFDTISVIKDVITVDLGDDIEVCSRDNVFELLSAPYGYTYLWSTGAITASFFATDFGTYWVEVLSNSGCKGIDTIQIIKINCTGIEEEEGSRFNIYPNPSNGELIIQSPSNNEGTITIVNLLGEQVFKTAIAQFGNTQITLPSSIQNGVYFVRVKTQNGTYSEKIVVSRE